MYPGRQPAPQHPPQPSSPQSRPAHVGTQSQSPSALQTSSARGQLPQDPPHPSGPQTRPAHCGARVRHSAGARIAKYRAPGLPDPTQSRPASSQTQPLAAVQAAHPSGLRATHGSGPSTQRQSAPQCWSARQTPQTL